ncbi:MAG TPA: T9SS type A sorting domain-containing protein [Ohtaekwangia sp.]|nr:T9SS type A sorting domain-containing protein [Ohtaekwangia sp.]
MKKLAIVLIFFTTNQLLYGQSEPNLNWQFGSLGEDLGEAGILVEDIDNNGVVEIISSGRNSGDYYDGTYHISILEFDENDNEYKVKAISNNYYNKITSLQILDFNNDGSKNIYAGFSDGTIHILDPITLKELLIMGTSERGEPSVFDPPNSIGSIQIGDYNSSGKKKLLVTNGDTTYIYNQYYKLENKVLFGAKFLRLGNIDNDSQTEFIYSNGQILEFSDDEFTLEYTIQKSNLEVPIELEDIDKDGVLDIIYSSHDTLFAKNMILNQLIWSTKWDSDYHYDRYISGLWLFDYNNDGTKDIFIGDEDWDAVYAYNGNTGAKDFSIWDNSSDGVVNLAVANLDNDENKELIWSMGAGCTCADYFFIYDVNSKEKEWQSKHFISDFRAFDIGDRDNDGETEIVSAVFGEYLKYYDHGFISVFDGSTKSIEWQNQEEIFNAHTDGFSVVEIADVDNDDQNDLLLGIDYGYSSSRVYAFADDYSIKKTYEIDGMDIIIDVAVRDIDQDNNNEVIVTSGTNVGGSTHPDEWQNYIYIFDGKTAEIEWKSPQLGGMSSKVGNIRIGNIDEDQALEVVAIQYVSWRNDQSVLYIVDAKTHDLIQKEIDASAFDLADFNNSGRDGLVVGTYGGDINIYNGITLEIENTIALGLGEQINAIEAVDFNGDNEQELAFASHSRLHLYDLANSRIAWRSGVINSNIGIHGSMVIGDVDGNDKLDIILNGNHALYNFEIENFESIASSPELDAQVFYIEEHSEVGTLIGRIEAFDINNNVLTYNLKSSDAPIKIEPITGEISVLDSMSLDFETNPSLRFEVEVQNEYGGKSVAHIYIHLLDIDEDEIITSITNSVRENIQIYPNPASHIVNIQSQKYGYSIISNLSGSGIIKSNKHEISLESLPSGIYVINIHDEYGNIMTRTKLIKN